MDVYIDCLHCVYICFRHENYFYIVNYYRFLKKDCYRPTQIVYDTIFMV